MEKNYTNEQFQQFINYHKTELEKEYFSNLEKAADQDYAADHWQSVLFTRNIKVPYNTILFHELIQTFEHFSKLYSFESAYDETFSNLDQIRKVAESNLTNALTIESGWDDANIHLVYIDCIENKGYELSELIKLEESVLNLTIENLTVRLAIHLAGKQLAEKYGEEEIEFDGIQQNNGDFTLNERLLTLHFLLASLGFKQSKNEDRTALASVYHLIMDKHFNDSTKIKNTNIYKSLGAVPSVVKDQRKLNGYLRNIRPYFEKANMNDALKLIDENIQNED